MRGEAREVREASITATVARPYGDVCGREHAHTSPYGRATVSYVVAAAVAADLWRNLLLLFSEVM